jgi:hypothetical protein
MHPDVPPDNNGSERELRPAATYREVTGGFRSGWGADLFAAVRSVIGTAARRGHDAYPAIRDVLDGEAAIQPGRADTPRWAPGAFAAHARICPGGGVSRVPGWASGPIGNERRESPRANCRPPRSPSPLSAAGLYRQTRKAGVQCVSGTIGSAPGALGVRTGAKRLGSDGSYRRGTSCRRHSSDIRRHRGQ